ncbi:MAG: MBL fold metallo-hydrolase [Negativicutes bacterium]|nr:MBL fold metallo-hydrolase [Negativicutes bacterium]
MQKPVHVSALPLDVDVFGTISKIHPVLLWDENGATLIDTGYPGIFAQLKQALEQKIHSFNRIKRIILTHQDWDHIGTVPDIHQALNGQVAIYAHAAEKPYLEGRLPHYKLTPERIAKRVAATPEIWREKARSTLSNPPRFTVDYAMTDGEILPFHGGIEVIHVPGHTPGNICLYVRSERLLIAGDQLRLDNGTLVGPAPEHTPDMITAQQSLKKLIRFDIDRIICYHGGTYTAHAASKIAELASL